MAEGGDGGRDARVFDFKEPSAGMRMD
jgi:hypothetical protein